MSKKPKQERSGEPATTHLDETDPLEFPRDHVKDPKTEPRNPQPDTVPQQQQPGQEAIPQDSREQADPAKTYVFTGDANHGVDGKRHTFKAGDEAKGLNPDELTALLGVGLIKEKEALSTPPVPFDSASADRPFTGDNGEPPTPGSLGTDPVMHQPETPQTQPGI